MNPFDIENILAHYVVCALWSSTGEDGEPLDDNYSSDDVAPATLAKMREDVQDFVISNTQLLLDAGVSEEQIGHDFWLTRNRHGAGFWDRGLGTRCQQLTHASHVYGEVDLYVGDDSLVHQA